MTWHEVSLKQICHVDWGNTKLTKSSYVNDGKFLAVSAAGADGLINHFEHEANVPVLSAIGAQCGRMFYPGSKFTAIKNTITLTPKENMADGKFLYYLFTHVQLPQRGAGQPFISKGDIEAFHVSIPKDVGVQRKIAATLDIAFSEIDLIEQNIEQLDAKAEHLLKSILNSSLKKIPIQPESTDFLTDQKSAPSENFIRGTIDELCNVEYGTRVVRKKDAGTIYPVYGGGGETFFLDTFNRENRVVVARFAMSEKCTRRVGGKFALNDSGLTLSPKEFIALSQDYLDYLVLSMNDQIYASARGTAQKNLDVPAFRQMEIFFPVSPERQQEIVETLDRAFAEIDLLHSQFKIQKDFAVELRNSLLSAAFTEAKEVA